MDKNILNIISDQLIHMEDKLAINLNNDIYELLVNLACINDWDFFPNPEQYNTCLKSKTIMNNLNYGEMFLISILVRGIFLHLETYNHYCSICRNNFMEFEKLESEIKKKFYLFSSLEFFTHGLLISFCFYWVCKNI